MFDSFFPRSSSQRRNVSTHWFSRLKSTRGRRQDRQSHREAIVENLEVRQLLSAIAPRIVGGTDVTITPRIVGGGDASVGEYPFIVSLQGQGPFASHTCGGTLIAEDWVLTAAHCGVVPGDEIVVGLNDLRDESGAQRLIVSEVFTHPLYTDVSTGYDIALLHLETPVTFAPGGNTGIARYATPADAAFFEPGDLSTAIGWGATFENGPLSNMLQEVQIPIVSVADANAPDAYDGLITDDMLPAGVPNGGRDTSQGDSGGPLLVRDADGHWIVAGITSFGFGSARPGIPGIYTRVASYADFIQDTIDANTDESTLGGVVFQDLDRDGFQDPDEIGLANQTVFIDLNGDGVPGSGGTVANAYTSTDVPLQLEQDNYVFSTLTVSGASTVSELSVSLDITHGDVGDLFIYLRAPDGFFYQLAGSLSGGANMTGTVFSDAATTSILSGTAPYTGVFQPINALSVLDGSDANGQWQLWVGDFGSGGSGTLDNWGIAFGSVNIAEPVTQTDANGRYAFPNMFPGTYTVQLDNSRGQFASGIPSTFRQTAFLPANSDRTNVNFGVVRQASANSVIGFNDGNGQFILSKSNGESLDTTIAGSISIAGFVNTTIRYGDFTGDGIDDVVIQKTSTGNWQVLAGTENGFASEVSFGPVDPNNLISTLTGLDVGDFNGDGLDDLIARDAQTGEFFIWKSRGDRFSTAVSLGTTPAGNNIRFFNLGDIDADGQTDFAFQDSQTGIFYTGRVLAGHILKVRTATKWNPAVRLENVMLGDFNGDGRDDLFYRVYRSGRIWVGTSNGARFRLNQSVKLNGGRIYDGVSVGDFNGDSIDDVILRHPREDELLLLTPTAAGNDFTVSNAGILQGAVDRFHVLDVDFDGKDDLLMRRPGSGEWFAWMSDGTTLTKNRDSVASWSPNQNWIQSDTIDATNVVLPVGGGDPITPRIAARSATPAQLSNDDDLSDFFASDSAASMLGDLI